jgi:hypothetical protein
MGIARQAQASTSGRPPAAGRTYTCQAVPIFLNFFILKKMNFWKFGKWARAFGRMGVQHPHFLKLHLEVLLLPKFMESGDFTFFQKKNSQI